MNQKIDEFLTKHRVCTLTTLRLNGSPHAAALHYSHKSEPLELYFSTEKGSIKCEALLNGLSSKASVVVGFSEEEWVTVQMDGEVQVVVEQQELEQARALHYPKIPMSAKFKDDPETVFLKFVPSWTRYTDYNTTPPTIFAIEF